MRDVVGVLCQVDAGVATLLKIHPEIIFANSLLDLERDCSLDEVIGLVVRSEIALSPADLSRLDRLRFIIRAGSGIDNLPLDLLSERGVHLYRNPGLVAESVAEVGYCAMIALARRMALAHNYVLNGYWSKEALVGDAVSELHVAIWGFGPVGRSFLSRCRHSVRSVSLLSWPSIPPGFRTNSLEELAQVADVHVLCLPLRESTRNVLSAEILKRMEARAPYILNLARLEVMDLSAALLALSEGRLRGLFVDPLTSASLEGVRSKTSQLPPQNLLLSEHVGAQRHDVLRSMGLWIQATLGELLSWR